MSETMYVVILALSFILIPVICITGYLTESNIKNSNYTRCLEVLYKDKQEHTIQVCKDITKLK